MLYFIYIKGGSMGKYYEILLTQKEFEGEMLDLRVIRKKFPNGMAIITVFKGKKTEEKCNIKNNETNLEEGQIISLERDNERIIVGEILKRNNI